MFKNILKYFILITFTLTSLVGGSLVYANEDISYENLTSSSVDLSWSGSNDIFFYKINYGTESGNVNTSSTDLIDGTSYSFEGLLENTTYYFTVVGYNELGNEGFLSNELSINTISKEVENKGPLYLVDSNQVGKTEVELVFSNSLDQTEGTDREFTIENISNANDYFEVVATEISEIEDNRLIIELDKEPTIGEEYRVVVLAITDKFNQNIENGVDIDATFIGIEIEEEVIEEEIIEEEPIEEEVIEEEVIEEEIEDSVIGVDLNAADVENNILTVAEDNSNLPKTGPEQLLIFILAFILSALIFVFKFKKA